VNDLDTNLPGPADLPADLIVHDELLAAVMAFPAAEIVAALDATDIADTGTAELAVLLDVLAVI